MGGGFAVPSPVQEAVVITAVRMKTKGVFLSCLVMMKLRDEELSGQNLNCYIHQCCVSQMAF